MNLDSIHHTARIREMLSTLVRSKYFAPKLLPHGVVCGAPHTSTLLPAADLLNVFLQVLLYLGNLARNIDRSLLESGSELDSSVRNDTMPPTFALYIMPAGMIVFSHRSTNAFPILVSQTASFGFTPQNVRANILLQAQPPPAVLVSTEEESPLNAGTVATEAVAVWWCYRNWRQWNGLCQ